MQRYVIRDAIKHSRISSKIKSTNMESNPQIKSQKHWNLLNHENCIPRKFVHIQYVVYFHWKFMSIKRQVHWYASLGIICLLWISLWIIYIPNTTCIHRRKRYLRGGWASSTYILMFIWGIIKENYKKCEYTRAMASYATACIQMLLSCLHACKYFNLTTMLIYWLVSTYISTRCLHLVGKMFYYDYFKYEFNPRVRLSCASTWGV